MSAGTIDLTVIEDDVAIDDHTEVAHNCHIGRQTTITGGVGFCGSVTVGARSRIAPQATIINGVRLREDCLVGLGAVVIMGCKDGHVLTGNPARVIWNKRAGTK